MEYKPDIAVRSPQDIRRVRAELIEYIFANTKLPEARPELEGETMLVRMQNGFTSRITITPPKYPNGALVIYHSGHEGTTWRDRAVMRRLVKEGYTVWGLDLPLIGANASPVEVELPRVGVVPVHIHRQFGYLAAITKGSPIRYFIEPVIAGINQGEAEGFAPIFMTGLSGGGWTTILAAALDTRIQASYPVAGSVPLGLRFDRWRKNWGDWEETLPELYQIASYEDLYILGAHGRSQLQVLNQFDNCCYNESRYILYEPAIQAALQEIGGEFKVFWSRGEFLHRANPAAVKAILEDMRRQQAH